MTRIVSIWLVLVGATITSLLLGENALLHNARAAGALVIAIAFVKVRLVGLHFMELRAAPAPLRLLLEGYCALVGLTLIVMFLVI